MSETAIKLFEEKTVRSVWRELVIKYDQLKNESVHGFASPLGKKVSIKEIKKLSNKICLLPIYGVNELRKMLKYRWLKNLLPKILRVWD